MSFFASIKRFFAPTSQMKGVFLRSLAQWLTWATQPIIHVYFIQKITFFIGQKDFVWFRNTLILYVISIVFYEICEHISRNWGWVESVPKTKQILGNELIPEFIKIDNNTVESIGTGKLVSIIEKGIDTWSEWIHAFTERGSAVTVTFIYVIYILFKNNILYLGVFILIVIFLSIFWYKTNKKTLSERKERSEYQWLYTKQLVKIIMSKFEILQSNKIEKEVQELWEFMKKNYFINIKVARYLHPYYRLPEFLLSVGKLSICYFLGKEVIDGTIDFSVFVGILTSLILMDSALNRLLTLYKDFTKEFPNIERLWDFFDNSLPIRWYDRGKKFHIETGDIKVENMSFYYHKEKPVFENFNVDIQWKKITALVWPSGWGKSTLAKMIAGYIHPTDGQILVDNQALVEISLKTYYPEIGYLTQEPSVFDGSIEENLTYALEKKPTKQKLEEAITLANAQFIYDLPKWLQTQIGERGIKLSGGQKQRLAIAKIFLKNPKIIILDEPTSALDSFSEEKITEAMHNLFAGRTVIVIAHRLQTVKNADEIIVIESGQIKERGTHTSLLKKNGYYKKMLDLQSGF